MKNYNNISLKSSNYNILCIFCVSSGTDTAYIIINKLYEHDDNGAC